MPAQLDRFVGRQRELSLLGQLLQQTRLLTLTGPAGCGKTRLALQLVAGVADRHPDGVWLVELASLGAPDLLPQTVASALGIAERDGQTLAETVAETLAGRSALLVLDNCEHLVEPCAAFAEALLRRSAPLTIIATSREALGTAGETTFRVPQLSLPRAQRGARRGELVGSDAVRLFVERAGSASPGFDLTPQNGPAVAAICQRLDGMPLAIELAARLVGFMSVDEILRRQSDRLDLLAGRRTAPGRHRSLRAAIEWSHELLDAEERAVFRRLSVFAGGFTVDWAAAVCAGGDVRASAVLGIVTRLAAKSLVTPLGGSGDSWRLHQLESIRLFALERLEESGEAETTRGRLADRVATFADEATAASLDVALARRLDEEHDNLLQVREWMARHGDERHVLLAAALARQWRRRAPLAEGRRLLDAVLADTDIPPPYRCAALHQAVGYRYWQGDYAGARVLAEEQVEIERRLDRPASLMRALERLAISMGSVGENDRARAQLEECLELARRSGETLDVIRVSNNLACMLIDMGEFDTAAALLDRDELREALRSGIEASMVASVLCTTGEIRLARGDHEGAGATFREALQTWRDDAVLIARAVGGLAIGAARSRPEYALRLVGAAAALREEARGGAEPLWERRVNEAATTARRLLPAAVARAALASGRRLSSESAAALALEEPARGEAGGQAPVPLTGREREVAALVARGLTNRQVGARLGISDRTVESHIEHLRQKLGLGSRTAIAVWAAGEAEAEAQAMPPEGR